MGLVIRSHQKKYNLVALFLPRKVVINMSRYKNGNPKKKSRFICCKCLQENMIGTGIQREHKQREKNHVKDLYCLVDKEVTKNLEVRYCDIFEEMMDKASELHIEYYGEKVKVG
jgi:hypothetical protein